MIYDIFINSFQVFLIVFARLMGMFVTAPFFSGMAMPMTMRLGFTFFVSLVSVPLVLTMNVEAAPNLVAYGVQLVSNFILGAGIGFFVFIIIASFQVSAQMFSIPMGLGMNEVVDPMSSIEVPAVGNILGILILFLLIRVDGHFYLIHLIVNSFRTVSVLSFQSIEVLEKGMSAAVMIMFDTGLKIALPIIAITLMLDMAMGLISRVAPQFNVMIMGFNIKLLAGFVILWLAIPVIVDLGMLVINGIMNTAKEILTQM
jgi:flagellar biosynthetic protein FliR